MGLSLNYCWLYANLGALEGLDPVGLMRDMYLAHRLSKERARPAEGPWCFLHLVDWSKHLANRAGHLDNESFFA